MADPRQILLSVIIPCYNEAENVARFESELIPALTALEIPYEIVLVDDGSADATAAAISRFAQARPEARIAVHARHRGLGEALKTGISRAEGVWIAALDADLTFNPGQIRDLLDRQKETDSDMVAGSPLLSAGGLKEVPWIRRAGIRIMNSVYRIFFGRALTAYTPIFRLYRRSRLKALSPRSGSFEINAEIAALFLKAGWRVSEVFAPLSKRLRGKSKMRPLRELKNHARLIARLVVE